jgi:hypothetical protein
MKKYFGKNSEIQKAAEHLGRETPPAPEVTADSE